MYKTFCCIGCSYGMKRPDIYTILYDSSCNLCQQSIRFIKRHDPSGRFTLIPLASSNAFLFSKHYGLNLNRLNSVVFIHKGKVYVKSSAILRIMLYLNGLWPALSVLLLIPLPLRNFFYGIVARYRYRWFGRCESCVV